MSKENDCGFSIGEGRFRYRAAAIIVENGYVLFAGNEKSDYLYSVGGAVQMGETAEDAVRREVREETGVEYEIDHLAVIHENFFFEDDGSSDTSYCHEIAFYFMMKPRGSMDLHSNSYTQGVKESMHWISVTELDAHRAAYPTFLKDYLLSGHTGLIHIVTDERESRS